MSTNTQSRPRRLLVLGATGATGRLIVRAALARGLDVAALVRSAAAAAAALPGATLIPGDATDPAVLAEAVRGRDAVISALGTPASPFRRVTLLSDATRALVPAMRAAGVPRLIAITGIGAGDSRGHGGLLFDRLILPLLLRTVYADKNRQEAIVRASGLDWVLVRPTMLTNGAGGGAIDARDHLAGVQGGRIARADVARFVLDQLDEDRWLGRTPLLRGA
ncbi:NAD(P)-dependent oxidoreductase [Sphingomonas morindae]|uniref:SDR family oxidoreductase n=1 Tax=Sphingomonas morindae TaxID=1541170 RepID=A0ABY4XDY8_9SPHN|nr:SDR family oxidoreductase [Sphingomonas morindae]USI74981.1 SDR family oxidoreductase [Sphingomonas morindae]